MTISDYLSFLFTGREIGDPGTASLLGLLDCRSAGWWDRAFQILELDEAMFSERRPTGTEIKDTHTGFARSLGFKSYDFRVGSLDHHMAATGAGVTDTESMSVSIGTVIACVNITDDYKPAAGICISPWKDGRYCQLAFDGNGAASLEWYQKNFAKDTSLEELCALAEHAGSSETLSAKPQAFKFDRLEDAFDNIKNTHTHGHFIYALMKSSAQTVNMLINKLSPTEKPKTVFAAGGGAKSSLWLKIISQITGCKVIPANHKEPATAGAGCC
jgi:xylulokinase